ncbi:MAG: hypothetical protein U0U46_17270 [Saprospiraceae bacterium]
MTLLFWILWAFDLLFTLFVLIAARFRSGLGLSTDLLNWLLLGLVICLVGGPVLRFAFRLRTASLVLVALPAASLLVAWLVSLFSTKQV